jgi:outer membrane protein OmpA-like peptidoglycan-associated protein
MKRILSILITLLIVISGASAQSIDGVKVENLQMKRQGEYMAVRMNMDFTTLDMPSNRAVLFTPVIVNGKDSLELSSVGIYGRRRYYYYVRNDKSIISESGKNYRASERPENMEYNVMVPYSKWMDGSYLLLHRSDYGCCNKVVDEQFSQMASFKEKVFSPQFVYVRPATEMVKTRSLSGSAYIDFIVNRTNINPNYRNNKVEIAKIQATIDSVKADADITLTSVSIKGFASPEGNYANNERLAKGRTESLKKHVQNLYDFAPDFIKTSYEPEDWAGLKNYVIASDLENKDEIIKIINSDLEPDKKELAIRTYGNDYLHLLTNCYPALRHSDYKVEYTIRNYKDVEEIKKVFAESPQNLSLEEFYILANEYGNGARELNDIFETAVRMYPNDPVANLNAAISEMQNKDFASAEPHLRKAGNSPEATYARGLYAAFYKDYDKALKLLTSANKQGVVEAQDAINQINEIK